MTTSLIVAPIVPCSAAPFPKSVAAAVVKRRRILTSLWRGALDLSERLTKRIPGALATRTFHPFDYGRRLLDAACASVSFLAGCATSSTPPYTFSPRRRSHSPGSPGCPSSRHPAPAAASRSTWSALGSCACSQPAPGCSACSG